MHNRLTVERICFRYIASSMQIESLMYFTELNACNFKIVDPDKIEPRKEKGHAATII